MTDDTEYTWRDSMVGERMSVDQEFAPRVADSEFSNQEWGLIMTAVSFEIAHPDDPDRARLVADTSKVGQIVPELEKIQQAGGMGVPGGGGSPGGPGGRGGGGSGGFLGSIKEALGLGGGSDGPDTEDVVSRADALTREYADKLQERLESNGKWESIRTQAAAEAGHYPEEGEFDDGSGADSDGSAAEGDAADATGGSADGTTREETAGSEEDA